MQFRLVSVEFWNACAKSNYDQLLQLWSIIKIFQQEGFSKLVSLLRYRKNNQVNWSYWRENSEENSRHLKYQSCQLPHYRLTNKLDFNLIAVSYRGHLLIHHCSSCASSCNNGNPSVLTLSKCSATFVWIMAAQDDDLRGLASCQIARDFNHCVFFPVLINNYGFKTCSRFVYYFYSLLRV